MIDPKELRIGNWLRCNDLFIQVSGISAGSFTCTHLGLLYFNSEDCHPIDLSPEILEKCGFESVDLEKWNFSKTLSQGEYLQISIQGWVLYFGHVNIPFHLPNPFKYLHELQNLIFTLSGEELQVNL